MQLWNYLFVHTFFYAVSLSNIHRYFNNNFHKFKVLKKIITTETFNVDSHNNFIKLWIIFFNFSSYDRIYLLIYAYIIIYIIARLLGVARLFRQITTSNRVLFSIHPKRADYIHYI